MRAKKYLPHIPQPLLDDLVGGKWLPVIGAGLSRDADHPTGATMPLWADLGQYFASHMKDYSYSSPLDAISAFEHEYGRPRLVEKLADLLLVDQSRPGVVHSAFCQLPFDLVCTTNFDFLLEQQYQIVPRHCIPMIDEDQLSISPGPSSVSLLKLHGDLHHPTRLVATEEDYDAFLTRYPLLSTFLANLLITRTAVLIGYSLDDPDFRQVWQVVSDRLGRSRRPAYALKVSPSPTDVARFERRGVKVIALPGKVEKYGEILSALFRELQEYWQSHILAGSHARDEAPTGELSLPPSTPTRLAFFALPFRLQPFYRERVFPLAIQAGLVPVTADDVLSPGESIIAKIDALLARAMLVVVDVSSESTFAEAGLALSRRGSARVLLVTEDPDRLPADLRQMNLVQRPDVLAENVEPFLETLLQWFSTMSQEFSPRQEREPQRLIDAGEFRAAVIAAVTLLETVLRERIGKRTSCPPTLRGMIEQAVKMELLPKMDVKEVLRWLQLRNEAVHTQESISRNRARQVVNGVVQLVEHVQNRTPL